MDRVEQVLDAVLDRFETNYFAVFERLDLLLAITEPTVANARALRNNFPSSWAVSDYFFSRASAAWIRPLGEAGFLVNPPAALVDEDNGGLQLPPWPESQYLVRVAADAPASAVDAALAIQPTDNSRVNYDLVRIASAAPPGEDVRLVPKIVEALSTRFGVLIPHEGGGLVVQLCRGG